MKSINEECGIFGIYNHPNAFEITKFGLLTLQHRGQEGCGIISYNQEFTLTKGLGLVNSVFQNINMPATSCIGHVRYSTTGKSNLENVQPFLIKSQMENFGVCHNGNLTNTDLLKCSLEKMGSIFHSSSDTEVIAHLFRRERGTRIERITASLQKLDGSFAFLLTFEDEMIAVRDKHGLRPLCLGIVDNSYVVASESSAFNVIGATFIRDIKPGEILQITNNGIKSYTYSKAKTKLSLCAMEYIYFARPDSTIDALNVHQARVASGKLLAENDIEADLVIGVPDSGLSAAQGYAQGANLPLEIGLIKNKYSGRTFIEPTDALRKQGIKLKLSVIKEVVNNRRVIIVDDSLVRGNTSRQLIKILREAGVKEVHMRIASPAIKYPCFYGVDFSTFDELVSNKYEVEQLCEFIGADSLKFLSTEQLKTTIGNNACMACFTGVYPTHTYKDIKQANKEAK